MIKRIMRPANDDIAIWIEPITLVGGRTVYRWQAHNASSHDKENDENIHTRPSGKYRCAGPINTFKTAEDAWQDAKSLFDVVGE